mgnify:CR=1 FL=1
MAVMCCMTMILPVTAAAAEKTVSVPVSVKLTGTRPYPAETYQIVLQANGANNPMPDGTVGDEFTLNITGESKEPSMINMNYHKVGIYEYTIYQLAGTNKQCTYDKSVYTLKVTISNNADYTDFEANVALRKDNDVNEPVGQKLGGAEFVNRYPVAIPDSPKTGDESSPMLYAVLICASMAVMVGLFLTRKRDQAEE